MSKNPVAHLLTPMPPWRTQDWPGVTGCSRLGGVVEGALLTPAEFAERVGRRRYGPPPAGLCGSCLTPAWRWARWPGWDKDPVAVIAEDCGWPNRTGRRARLAAELHAVTALIAAHPGEFAALVEAELVIDALGGGSGSGVRR
jgi:hypothetical protein